MADFEGISLYFTLAKWVILGLAEIVLYNFAK